MDDIVKVSSTGATVDKSPNLDGGGIKWWRLPYDKTTILQSALIGVNIVFMTFMNLKKVQETVT